MSSLVILGAREHAKMVFATLQDALSKEWEVLGFLDDNSSLHGKDLLGLPILGPIQDMAGLAASGRIQGALVGISCNHMAVRARLFSEIKRLRLQTPSVISPTAHVHRLAAVGEGSVIFGGAVVNAFARVGSNFVAYSNAVVEHECVLGDNVYLGPGVAFCGSVRVGNSTFIGTGSSVVCEKIGDDVVVGAGAAVVRDLPDGAVAVGVPSRILQIRTPE